MKNKTKELQKLAEEYAQSSWAIHGQYPPYQKGFVEGALHASKIYGDIINKLVEAMEKSIPMIRGCSRVGDHDDPSWCTESCGDYGKTLRKAINSLEDK